MSQISRCTQLENRLSLRFPVSLKLLDLFNLIGAGDVDRTSDVQLGNFIHHIENTEYKGFCHAPACAKRQKHEKFAPQVDPIS